MKAIELKMPDEVHQKLASLAARENQPLSAFALRKLEELIHAVEGFYELERRAQRGDRERFKEAMAKVPEAPPVPGDELPFDIATTAFTARITGSESRPGNSLASAPICDSTHQPPDCPHLVSIGIGVAFLADAPKSYVEKKGRLDLHPCQR